jgi:hypothetical protein
MPQESVLLTPGTSDFAAYLNGFQECVNARQAEAEARNLQLRLIGEITEVVALEGLDIAPAQILALAATAQSAMTGGAMALDWTTIVRDLVPRHTGDGSCPN